MYEFEKIGRIPFNEFSTDLEYQKTMDTAWHNWLQPKYAKQFKAWEEKQLSISKSLSEDNPRK